MSDKGRREHNINNGVPDHSGLDDDTRAALERQLGDRHGIAVNSFADLQRGTVTSDPTEGPFAPGQDTEVLTPGEHDAAVGIASPEAATVKGSKKKK